MKRGSITCHCRLEQTWLRVFGDDLQPKVEFEMRLRELGLRQGLSMWMEALFSGGEKGRWCYAASERIRNGALNRLVRGKPH